MRSPGLFIYIFIFSLSLLSCFNKGAKNWELYLSKANNSYTSNPSLASLYLDSAKNAIHKNDLPDSFLIQPLELRAKMEFNLQQFDKGHLLLDSAADIARKNHLPRILMRIYTTKGNSYFLKEEYRKARYFLNEAIRIGNKELPQEDLIPLNITYGSVLMSMEEFKPAQELYLQILKIAEKKDSNKDLGKIYTNIGSIYQNLGDLQKAKEYYHKALLSYKDVDDSLSLSKTYMNIGILSRKKNPDSTNYYYELSDKFDRKQSDQKFTINRLFNRAIYNSEQNQHDKAFQLFDSVLTLSKKQGLLSGITRAYHSLAIIALRKNDLSRAEQLADSAIHYALLGSEKKMLSACYDIKTDVLAARNKFPEAFRASELARKQADSVNTIYSNIAIRKLEIDFEGVKKELENNNLNELLEQEKRFSSLQSIALLFFIILSVVLTILYRKNKILQKEKGFAYDALMDNYIRDKQSREENITELKEVNKEENYNNALLEKLINYFETEKPYHDPTLKRATVEEYLQVTEKELSQALREHRTRNFNAFVNYFRVEDTKRKMEDPALNQLTIEALALESGFGSRQNFYKVFETLTGVKPSHYRAKFLELNKE